MKKKQNFFTKDHFIRTISSFLLSLSFFLSEEESHSSLDSHFTYLSNYRNREAKDFYFS